MDEAVENEDGRVMAPTATPLDVPALPHAKLWFCLQAHQNVRLPKFLGSMIRGALARSMKRIACMARRVRECQQCPFFQSCVYAYLFESPRPIWARRYATMTTIPHPIVIETEERSNTKETASNVSFAIRLFGRAIDSWAYLVMAVREMARSGLGSGRAVFDLVTVADGHNNRYLLYERNNLIRGAYPSIYEGVCDKVDFTNRINISFLTPTRLVEEGDLLDRPNLAAFIRSIAFRAATISYFHCGLDWDPTCVEAVDIEQNVREVEASIEWSKLRRYSSRQGQMVPLDGFIGHVTYEGPSLHFLLPLLRLGEILHVGKGTVFGLGQVAIKRLDEP